MKKIEGALKNLALFVVNLDRDHKVSILFYSIPRPFDVE